MMTDYTTMSETLRGRVAEVIRRQPDIWLMPEREQVGYFREARISLEMFLDPGLTREEAEADYDALMERIVTARERRDQPQDRAIP